MAIATIFSEFLDTLNFLRAEERTREGVRQTMEKFGDELKDGLQIVIVYIKGIKKIEDKEVLIDYLENGIDVLGKNFSVFKICAGLRGLHDRLKHFLTAEAWAVHDNAECRRILHNLQLSERMISDQVREFFFNLHLRILAMDTDDIEQIHVSIDAEVDVKVEELRDQMTEIDDLIHSFFDKM